jgi:NADPH-dependent ferric siderophore reductase
MSMTNPTMPADRGRGGRRRQPPQTVEVVSVSSLTPRMVSVRLGGDLSRFATAAPTSHIKLFLPLPGQDEPVLPVITPEGRTWPSDDVRPVIRTYTPRSYDPETGTLEVQFVLHGDGPAAAWAQRAKPGGKIALGGPGGRFAADLDAPRWWIAADESALPAAGTLLDALPAAATAEVHVEAAGPDDEIALKSQASTAISWHHRHGGYGDALYDAAASAAIDDATLVWVACEAGAMRRIRRHLLDSGVAPSALITRGYWRLGEVDHPDHDYGED